MDIDIYNSARKNLKNELSKLIEQGVDINKPNEFGNTSLHYAISKENIEIALMLIKNGADGSIQDKGGSTPLEYAAEYNLYDVAKAILEKNPETIHIADKHGNQPLWRAVFKAKKPYDLIKLFVEYGAEINHRNNVDASPLDLANDYKVEEIINILTKSDVSIINATVY